MELNLRGKTALVTAASRGIGYAIAQGLAKEGCRLIITSSNGPHIEMARERIASETGAHVSAYVQDLRDPAGTAASLMPIARTHAPIDILVVNVPGPPPLAADAIDAAHMLQALNTVLLSAVALCHAIVPRMKTAGFGRVIFLTSSTAKEPDEGMVLSSTARAGVLAYAKSLSREVARCGITVNSILTGSVDTQRSDELFMQEARQTGIGVDELRVRAAESIPAGYICSPEEFAKPVVFLCSQAAAYINGVALPIDGGYMRGI